VNRRTFLIRCGETAALVASSKTAVAANTTAELVLREAPNAPRIPLTYTGLSYELAQLSDPDFFSASNRALVAHFRLLSPHGILRVGGNSSEFCWFKADASTPEPTLHVPRGDLNSNWMPHQLFAIEPRAIDQLAGFLRATNWRLIYGLNLGNSTPARAATEAAYVASKIGPQLEYFQIGNEPDLYHNPTNGTRPSNWGFDDYVNDWSNFARAILSKVPNARFGGPDVASSSDWVVRFAESIPQELPNRIAALTGHYYAEGPPDDPRVTIERLLRPNPRIAESMSRIEQIAKPRSLVYRMSEGNSCYRAGKPGLSNAFAAALWGGDYMLQTASLGCVGVNFHGGQSGFLTRALGNHNPGLDSAKAPTKMHGGYYTPIQSEPGQPVRAMPVFYGMMLANQLAGGTMLACDLKTDVDATAYAASHASSIILALFNKDSGKSLDLSIRAPHPLRAARAWRLQAPSLDAIEGITLAGASIDDDHARWTPTTTEKLNPSANSLDFHLPAASAALLFLNS